MAWRRAARGGEEESELGGIWVRPESQGSGVSASGPVGPWGVLGGGDPVRVKRKEPCKALEGGEGDRQGEAVSAPGRAARRVVSCKRPEVAPQAAQRVSCPSWLQWSLPFRT